MESVHKWVDSIISLVTYLRKSYTFLLRDGEGKTLDLALRPKRDGLSGSSRLSTSFRLMVLMRLISSCKIVRDGTGVDGHKSSSASKAL